MINDLENSVNKIIENKKGDIPAQSVIRDTVTQLLHIADKKNMDVEEILIGAKEVFEIEKAEDLSDGTTIYPVD